MHTELSKYVNVIGTWHLLYNYVIGLSKKLVLSAKSILYIVGYNTAIQSFSHRQSS